MALNLSKLIGFHRFKWSSDSLGNVLVHNLSLSANSVLNKRFESYLEADSSEFIRILITAVCQLDSENTEEYTDDRVSYEQSKLLNDEELNNFSEKFLEKNSYLKNDRSKSTSKKKKNENGELVTTIEYEKRDDEKKLEDESYCDVLKRLMHHSRVHHDEQIKKLFDSLKPKSIFSDSVLGLIDQNRKLSDKLGSSINKMGSK